VAYGLSLVAKRAGLKGAGRNVHGCQHHISAVVAPCRLGDRACQSVQVTPTISVVMAEDNLLVREGVRGILAGDADLVVTDIHMPPDLADDGIRIARELRRDSPSTGVVVLSSRDDPQHALDLLEDGASGRAYLLKERVAQPGQLVDAVRAVADGGSVIDPRVVESLIQSSTRPHASAPSALSTLSPRELDVLSAMAGGANNSAIAAQLFLTVRAVERHINSLFAKLGLSEEPDYHRRVRAVLLYLAEA
jgi:DNA-binding NarL/FixJ family response regulator